MLALLLAAGGCGSSHETETELYAVPPDTAAAEPPAQFVTKTDTVTAQGSRQQPEHAAATSLARVRYMVQIGSFREPLYASTVQSIARSRYTVPVVNDYNAGRRLFQVRIGFFETVEAAVAFRAKLQAEYPNDYRDAWIVQIGR